MNIGSPAIHCNGGSAGTSAEPLSNNNRPLFVFGQNQDGTPHRFNDNIIAQASTTSNNNTNNVSNNNSTQGNENYAFTTPSTKNNSTGSSFNVYDKNGATSLEAVGAPWDQGGSGYINRLFALSNNRANGNISSNCITISIFIYFLIIKTNG